MVNLYNETTELLKLIDIYKTIHDTKEEKSIGYLIITMQSLILKHIIKHSRTFDEDLIKNIRMLNTILAYENELSSCKSSQPNYLDEVD